MKRWRVPCDTLSNPSLARLRSALGGLWIIRFNLVGSTQCWRVSVCRLMFLNWFFFSVSDFLLSTKHTETQLHSIITVSLSIYCDYAYHWVWDRIELLVTPDLVLLKILRQTSGWCRVQVVPSHAQYLLSCRLPESRWPLPKASVQISDICFP